MVVATRSFTTTYDGHAIQITAGQTRVATNHELARSHPSAWTSADRLRRR